MTEEQIKEHLLANFCDGDSWEDAKADRFTHEGALEIAKYFHDEGFKAGSEQNNPTVEGTETEEEQIRKFTNRLSFGLHVSNDTMDAIRLFRKELPDFLQSTRADERKKIVEVVKGIVSMPAFKNLKTEQGQLDEEGILVEVSRQALDEVLSALEDVLAKMSQV